MVETSWSCGRPAALLSAAAFAISCGTSHGSSRGGASGGTGGDVSAHAGMGSAAGGTGTGGTSAGTGANAGGSAGRASGGTAGSTSEGGESATNTGGQSASGGSGAQSGTGNVSVVVGNGELDETCMSRTSLSMAGGRIVLRNAVTAAGDKAFIGFYDTVQSQQCEPTLAADGKVYCMPPAHDKDQDNRYFLDEQCTDEVEYQGICDLEFQAEPVSSDTCDQRRRIYPFGDPLPDTMVFSPDAQGKCQPYSTLNHLHRRGPELNPSDYAELEPVVWRGKGRIGAEGYQGDGGLHIVNNLFDSELGQACSFEFLADGKERCAPMQEGLLGYTDSTCKQTLLESTSACGAPPPRYASPVSGDSCNRRPSFIRATDAYTGSVYVAGSCMPSQTKHPSIFMTEPAPDDDFLAADTTTVSGGTSRLQPMYRTTLDGGCFFRDFWDSELQTACSFQASSPTGTYYCLPNSDASSPAIEVSTFSDSECKVSAPYVKVPNCSGGKPPRFLADYAPACVTWHTIRAIEQTPAVAPALWTQSGDACVVYTLDGAATYYAAGDVMPTSLFVAGSLQP